MSNVALALIFASFIVASAAIIAGAMTFTPSRAAAVMHAERLSPLQVDQVSLHLRRRLPRRLTIRKPRLDRHDAYVWVMSALWFVGLGVLLAPSPTSVVSELSWDSQKAIGICLFVGASVALVGICLGLRVTGEHYIARWVVDNMVSELIGEDIRIPYAFGCLGLMSAGIGLAGFGWTIYRYSTLVGTLSGALTFGLCGMCITLSARFFARIRDYVRKRNPLLAQIARRMEADD